MKLLVHATTTPAEYRAYIIDNGRLVSDITFNGYSSMIDFIITMGIEYVAIHHKYNELAIPSRRLYTDNIKDDIALSYATRKGRKRYIEVGVE